MKGEKIETIFAINQPCIEYWKEVKMAETPGGSNHAIKV